MRSKYTLCLFSLFLFLKRLWGTDSGPAELLWKWGRRGGGGGLNSDSKWGAENIWAEAPPPPPLPLPLRGPWTSKAIYVSCFFQTTLDSMRFHQKSSTISVVYGPMFIAPYIASHKISTGLLKQPLPYDNGTFSSYTYKNSLLCLL